GPREVGFVMMYSGFLGILVQSAMRQGALVRRVGEARLVTLGFLFGSCASVLVAFSFGIGMLLFALTVSSLGTGLVRPALTSLITQQVGRSEQGVVLGLNQSLLSVAQIAGPAIAGAMIDRGWLTAWAFWAAAITLCALVLNRGAHAARDAAHRSSLERAAP